MSGYESASLTEIEAVLDGLDEATAAEVYDATRGYSPKALAAVAASRADAAGGGPGAGGVEVLGPFEITYQSANLIDPADNGYEISGLTLPAGNLSRIVAIQTDDWTGSQSGDGLYLVAALTVGGAASNLAIYDIFGEQAGAAVGMTSEFGLLSAGPVELAHRDLCPTVDAKVYAAIYTQPSTITAGSADVYAVVYS